jgi:hypothetical protein
MTTRSKPSKDKIEAATAESQQLPVRQPSAKADKPQQLELILVPVPDDAEEKVIELLFALAMKSNISAAKLFLDYCHSDPDDEPVFTAEDALKLLQDHLRE